MDPAVQVPSIRAQLQDGRLVIRADGPVEQATDDGAGGMAGALGRWADSYAATVGIERLPTLWCSWYEYFTRVTEPDVLEHLAAMDELDLPVDVVQLDDGYQTEIGD